MDVDENAEPVEDIASFSTQNCPIRENASTPLQTNSGAEEPTTSETSENINQLRMEENVNTSSQILASTSETMRPPNEQQIEGAGIDPKYPLLSVRRVSFSQSSTSVGENQESSEDVILGMEESPNARSLSLTTTVDARETEQNEQQIEGAGIDPKYPLLLVRRVSFSQPSTSVGENQESSEHVILGMEESPNARSLSLTTTVDARETEQNEQQIEGAGIDPNYPLVLVQRVSFSQPSTSADETQEAPEDTHELRMEESTNARSQSLTSTADASETDSIQERQQNEQHIEEAGIDPNYPLVLVQRVSLSQQSRAADENQENAVAMDEENAQHDADADSSMDSDNVINFFHIDTGEGNNEVAVPERVDEEDDDEEEEDIELDTWSVDDEDEAAIVANPNLREFSNQFVVIRNMIEQTRRSMAETEANFGPSELLPRNMLMQRFRRILFILNNRRRRLIRLGMNTSDEENPEAEANAEMEAANDDNSHDNDDEENAGNDANNEDAHMSLEQEEEMNENAIRFDTNLPAEHSYMGSNMNRVSGVNYLDADQYIKLRLFLHQHVLFPGEVLPFMVDSSTTVIEGDVDAQNGILFGLCFPSLSNNNTANGEKKDQLLYGVTCQIYELGTDDRGNTLIKSRALQRFVTKLNDLTVPLEYINSHPRMKCQGFVKILPDIYLPEPLKNMNMGSMNRFRDNASMQQSYRRFQAATTPWPLHVFETHNMTTIVEKARTQLAQHKIDTMPSDPTQLSYWLVRNLHLPEKMLKSVFLANTVNTRLKLIASTFKEEAVFSCRSCATHIANCRELFAMSKHGVQSQYCNSAGYIHETNTVYQVNRSNILYSGSPSTEFSWFPGYQWHIIVCKVCDHHLGWEFKAVEPNLIPKQFFGISSGSVRVRSANEHSADNSQGHNAFYNFIRLMNAGVNIE